MALLKKVFAAAAVGREQLFHDTMPPGETQALSLHACRGMIRDLSTA
ncbi:MAG: hypothetical protein RLZZ282_945 [Verrucomicrobiota bacterium]|jgi:hypothetical protein